MQRLGMDMPLMISAVMRHAAIEGDIQRGDHATANARAATGQRLAASGRAAW
jgi:hypothetical protein